MNAKLIWVFFEYLDTHIYVTFLVIAIYFILLPLWVMVVLYNKHTRPVLKSGWIPVLSALFISGYVIITHFSFI